jgi:hypothetical protein
MPDLPYPVQTNYPSDHWLTGHPALDPLLTLWRENWRNDRPPRWSEISEHLTIPGGIHFIMACDHGGMRQPSCALIHPTAATLLGLPPNFTGTDWSDQTRPHRIATLIRTIARGQRAAQGSLSPGPGSHHLKSFLLAVGVPLAPEPGSATWDRAVVMSVAWPEQG